jgi:hypothetical protein
LNLTVERRPQQPQPQPQQTKRQPSYFGGYRPGFSLARNPVFPAIVNMAQQWLGPLGGAAAMIGGLDWGALGTLTGGRQQPRQWRQQLFEGDHRLQNVDAMRPEQLTGRAASTFTPLPPSESPVYPEGSGVLLSPQQLQERREQMLNTVPGMRMVKRGPLVDQILKNKLRQSAAAAYQRGDRELATELLYQAATGQQSPRNIASKTIRTPIESAVGVDFVPEAVADFMDPALEQATSTIHGGYNMLAPEQYEVNRAPFEAASEASIERSPVLGRAGAVTGFFADPAVVGTGGGGTMAKGLKGVGIAASPMLPKWLGAQETPAYTVSPEEVDAYYQSPAVAPATDYGYPGQVAPWAVGVPGISNLATR